MWSDGARNYNWQTLNLVLEPLAGIELGIDIAELSALLMGSASVEALYRFGRARVSSDHLPTLARLFLAERPTCLTAS